MNKWTRSNPLAAVPGYNVPRGHFANGYTNGGDRVGFKKGGRASEKSTHPSSRFKHTPKQPHGRHSPGNIKALYKAWGRTEKKKPHSTKEGRHATASRKFGRVLKEAAGMRTGGTVGLKKGGRIGLKRGSPRTERDAAKAELHRAQIKSNGSHYTTTLGGFPIRSDWHKAIKKHEKKFPKLVKNIKYNTKKDFKKVKPSPQRRADGGRVGLKGGGEDKWIQKATKGMRKDKPCTGKKFGGASCPPGSKRYNLAKTFKKMAKKRKS